MNRRCRSRDRQPWDSRLASRVSAAPRVGSRCDGGCDLRLRGGADGRRVVCGGAVLQLFCRATGFNGTTQVATSAPASAPLARKVAVRFDSNVAGGLPWKFEPENTEIEVRIGEVVTCTTP